MPCPKCSHILIKEDGVTFCEECLHVTERKDDPEFEFPKLPSKPKPIPKLKRLPKKKPGRKSKLEIKKQPLEEKICLLEGCDKPVFSRGLSKNCYHRDYYRRKQKVTCVLCSKPLFAKKLCRSHFGKVYGIEYERLYDGQPK